MAKGFKDSKGRFRPTGNKGVSSKSKTTKPEGLMYKPTPKREKFENRSLEFQLARFDEGDVFSKTLEISPNTFLKAVQNDPNWTPAFGVDSTKEIKKRLEEGEELDKPFLLLLKGREQDRIIGHQGRHRAFTAKELGIKTIPVEIWCQDGKLTAKCKQTDEKVLTNALSQFPSSKEDEETRKEFQKHLKGLKKQLQRLKKIENPQPHQEQEIFEVEFEIRNLENVSKLGNEMQEKRQKKKKKIKEIFN